VTHPPYFIDPRWKEVTHLPKVEGVNPTGKHWHALLSLLSDQFARISALEEQVAAAKAEPVLRLGPPISVEALQRLRAIYEDALKNPDSIISVIGK
jgi:hypothetical protein